MRRPRPTGRSRSGARPARWSSSRRPRLSPPRQLCETRTVDVGQTLDPKRWFVLGITVAAFFMTLLDATIVNVALPTIGNDLGFSRSALMWVLTAYALTFGGFL